MAILIPTRNSCLARMTAGEKRFSERLEQKLEDDYLIWYDVPIGFKQRHPDFVILHPRRGLLVLEVKDWKADSIRQADPRQFQLATSRGLVKENNPLLQARACALEVKMTLERDPALRFPPAHRHAGKLVMPWAWGAVLTQISRKQFVAGGLGELMPEHLVICQDEIFESVDAETFQEHLWAMFPQVFPVALSLPQIDRVRWHLFPELRVEPGNGQFGLFDEPPAGQDSRGIPIPNLIAVMDRQQESLARSLGGEHRIIHGVAGSGKTMILGFRASHLAQALDKPILILCYNKTLAARLEQMMATRGLSAKVQVYNFHRWCTHMLRSYHVAPPAASGQAFYAALPPAVIEGVDKGRIPRFQYGAILIDEGHDFEPDWYRLIVQMVDPSSNSLLILYDDAQNIYGQQARRKTSWKSLGVQARGRTTILRLNYRNTLEILSLARSFARHLLDERSEDEDGIPLLHPESAGRRGPLPELVRANDARHENQLLLAALEDAHDHGHPWQAMAILYHDHREGARLASLLDAAGIPCTLADGQGKRALFAEGDTVKLVTMHSSKGLEFAWVFLPGLGQLPKANRDEAEQARLLYVAMTRATDHLQMLHHAESVFTRRIRASIHAIQGQLAPAGTPP